MSKRKRNHKPKSQPPKRWPKYVIVLVIIGSIVLGVYGLTLPIWDIKEVVINGAVMLADEEIRTMASIPVSENLFFSSFSRAKTNLSKITAIKSFRIYRMPPATVLINIKEREPIAVVVFPEKSYLVDQEGYLINHNPNITLNISNLADLPIVSGIKEEQILKAEKVDDKNAQVISEIILKLSPFLEAKRMQLELGGLKNVSFLLDDLLRVKMGEATDIKRKMAVFSGLLPVISGQWTEVEYIDVRFPDNPVIKFESSG